MHTPTSLRAWHAFRRWLAVAGFLGATLWMFQSVLAQSLAVGWSTESESTESENRYGAEDPDCRKQAPGNARSRSREVLAVVLPHTAICTVRNASMARAAHPRPAPVPDDPAWSFPLRC